MECLVSLLKLFGPDLTARLSLPPGTLREQHLSQRNERNGGGDKEGWLRYCMKTGHCGGCDEMDAEELLSSIVNADLPLCHTWEEQQSSISIDCSSSAVDGTTATRHPNVQHAASV